MASIKKILKKSHTIDLPKKELHELGVNKMFFIGQAVLYLLPAVLILFNYNRIGGGESGNSGLYFLAVGLFISLLAVSHLFTAFTGKVKFNEDEIIIPGMAPFTKERIQWENIEVAELTGVITYRNFIELLFKKIFSSIFSSAELHVLNRSLPGQPKYNFPVLQRVGDKAMAVCIIREKLGDRFTVYSKNK